MKLHAGDIEIILARHFGYRQNLIVPNVSWGLGLHEIDLLVVTQASYATEIEIKISLSDLKADSKKRHNHRSNRIKQLYFAVPETLRVPALELIPERAGLFVIHEDIKQIVVNGRPRQRPRAEIVRAAHVNRLARKFTDKERQKLGQLAAMRIWSLKECVYRQQRERVG